MAREINVGTWVFTADGKELGRVKAVADEEFLVDAPLARDYWLERSLVQSASDARIELVVTNADLAGYKMDRPHDADGFHQKVPNTEASAVRDRNMWRQG